MDEWLKNLIGWKWRTKLNNDHIEICTTGSTDLRLPILLMSTHKHIGGKCEPMIVLCAFGGPYAAALFFHGSFGESRNGISGLGFKNSSLTRWWLILVLIICVARHRMQGMLPKQLCWHLFERTTFSCPIQDKSVTLQQKPCWIAAKKLLWMLVVRQACIGHLGILAKVSGMWTVTKCKASSALKHWVHYCMKSRMCKHEILCSVILGSPCLAWMSVIPMRWMQCCDPHSTWSRAGASTTLLFEIKFY